MIRPLKDFLLLRAVDETETVTGLFVPEDGTAKIRKGEVMAIGQDLSDDGIERYFVPLRNSGESDVVVPDKNVRVFKIDVGNIPPDQVDKLVERVKVAVNRHSVRYAVGDIVLYSIYGANEVREDGKKFLLVPDKEVLAVIDKEKTEV